MVYGVTTYNIQQLQRPLTNEWLRNDWDPIAGLRRRVLAIVDQQLLHRLDFVWYGHGCERSEFARVIDNLQWYKKNDESIDNYYKKQNSSRRTYAPACARTPSRGSALELRRSWGRALGDFSHLNLTSFLK